MKKSRILGWTVYIFKCSDGSYHVGMCRDLNRKFLEINRGKGIYFSKHPERFPVSLVFCEKELLFREAYAKSNYMKEMNRKLKEKLIKTSIWPVGGPWKEYILRADTKI